MTAELVRHWTFRGAALTLPLALWSTVPGCAGRRKKWVKLGTGVFQSLILAYAAQRLRHTSLPAGSR